jgi:hypothetical protein
MGAGTLSVHFGCTYMAFAIALVEKLHELVSRLDIFDDSVLHENHFLGIHFDIKFGRLATSTLVIEKPIQVLERLMMIG